MASPTSTYTREAKTRDQSFEAIRPQPPKFPFSAYGSPRESYRGTSGPASTKASTTAFHVPGVGSQRYFRSRRIKDASTISKPWTEVRDPKRKWHTIFPLIGLLAGLAIVGLLCWQGYTSVINHDYCLIYEDDFSSGALDKNVWTKEVQVGGFGNGNFEQTTDTDENVFVRDGELWIKPTLQDENLIKNNNVLDLTKQGLCTSDAWFDCHAVTNTTNGTIINPAKSGRINTKKGATIRYGKCLNSTIF